MEGPMRSNSSRDVLLGVALLSVCAIVEAKPPTCNNPVGKWQDELLKYGYEISAHTPFPPSDVIHLFSQATVVCCPTCLDERRVVGKGYDGATKWWFTYFSQQKR